MGRYYDHLLREERRLTAEHVARNMGFYDMERFVKQRTVRACRRRLAVRRPAVLKFDAWEEASRQGPHNLLPRTIDEILSPGSVTCLDMDQLLLREAMARHGRCNRGYVVGRIEALPFGRDSFDVLIDFSTTDHIVDDGAFASTIAESHRVLKRGGYYLLYHANADYILAQRRSSYHTARTLDQVQRVLEAAGFHVEAHCFLYPMLYDPSTLWCRLWEGGRALMRRLPDPVRQPVYTGFNLKWFNEFFFMLARRGV